MCHPARLPCGAQWCHVCSLSPPPEPTGAPCVSQLWWVQTKSGFGRWRGGAGSQSPSLEVPQAPRREPPRPHRRPPFSHFASCRKITSCHNNNAQPSRLLLCPSVMGCSELIEGAAASAPPTSSFSFRDHLSRPPVAASRSSVLPYACAREALLPMCASTLPPLSFSWS